MLTVGDNVVVRNASELTGGKVGTIERIVKEDTYPYKVVFLWENGKPFVQEYKATEIYKVAPAPAKASKEFLAARTSLLEDFKPGDKVYVIRRQRSKSGATHKLSFLVLTKGGFFLHPNHAVATLLGHRLGMVDGHDVVIFKDRGYGEIARSVVGELAKILFGDATALITEEL